MKEVYFVTVYGSFFDNALKMIKEDQRTELLWHLMG